MASAAQSQLVPEEYSDFRTKTFWEGFFQAREGKSFEWYGDWTTLRQVLTNTFLGTTNTNQTNEDAKDAEKKEKKERRRQRILVPGCGNSKLSSDLYDAGYEEVTNVDFSPTCVREMLVQNVRKRPKMRWLVMDMTDMKQFKDESFDYVVDKGSLDALMGDAEDTEGTRSGHKFLSEVKRVMSRDEGAAYVIVTLSQDHVLETILHAFSSLATDNNTSDTKWKVTMHSIPPTKDMRNSPWQPFALVAQRKNNSETAMETASSTSTSTRISSSVIDVELNFSLGGRGSETAQMREVRGLIERWVAKAETNLKALCRMGNLCAGQRVLVDLPQGVSIGGAGEEQTRFKAAILDASDADSAGGKKTKAPCAVFIVPQGREHEWLFQSEEGQRELLSGCNVSRLVIVSLVRDQTYGKMAEIQSELSPLVMLLVPSSCRDKPDVKIEYLTIVDGVGERKSIHKESSSLNGDIVVEDVTLQEKGQPRVFRRMVFLENSNLIQSEALVNVSKGPGKKGKRGQRASSIIDHSYLSCDYHLAISAGISFAGLSKRQPNEVLKVLLIGLGGGGLAMFLAKQFYVDVTVIELDPVVEGLAKEYFGFCETDMLRSLVGDGLKYVKDYSSSTSGSKEQSRFDVVIVDASGSSAESISCPPKEFLEEEFLSSLSNCLSEEGVMCVNIVSRSNSAFVKATGTLKSVFRRAVCISAEDDINKVVFAFKGDGKRFGEEKTLKDEASQYIRETQRTKAHQEELLSGLSGLVKV